MSNESYGQNACVEPNVNSRYDIGGILYVEIISIYIYWKDLMFFNLVRTRYKLNTQSFSFLWLFIMPLVFLSKFTLCFLWHSDSDANGCTFSRCVSHREIMPASGRQFVVCIHGCIRSSFRKGDYRSIRGCIYADFCGGSRPNIEASCMSSSSIEPVAGNCEQITFGT